jgi:PEGA domain
MCTALLVGCVPPATKPLHASALPATEGVRAARALDQQGVLAFEAGRYHDALLYFDAAFAHGGPPSERWNAAKCHLHLDEPSQAEAALVEYLALPGLSIEDRREADAALSDVRRRQSTLMVLSVPLGLSASVDGRHVGTTPVAIPVAPGDHIVVVERAPDARQQGSVTARLGRSILIEAHP